MTRPVLPWHEVRVATVIVRGGPALVHPRPESLIQRSRGKYNPEVRSTENHASTLYRELRAKAPAAPLSELLQSLIILVDEVKNKEVEKWAKLEFRGLPPR